MPDQQEQSIREDLAKAPPEFYWRSRYLLARLDACYKQLRERDRIIRELWDFIDTYGYADNSGGEYRPACIACGTSSQKHEVGCELEKILTHPAMRAGEE